MQNEDEKKLRAGADNSMHLFRIFALIAGSKLSAPAGPTLTAPAPSECANA
jgi:hypothetical protein